MPTAKLRSLSQKSLQQWSHRWGQGPALDEAAVEEAAEGGAQLLHLADGVLRQAAHHRQQRAHAQRQPRPQLHYRQPAAQRTSTSVHPELLAICQEIFSK